MTAHWMLEDPRRFLYEREQLAKLQQEADWLEYAEWKVTSNLQLAVEFGIRIHNQLWEFTLEYPELFPETPPTVSPSDGEQRVSGHQYGAGGPLCLEWRADNWSTHITGGDLVRSTHRLISAEKHPTNPAPVPSAEQRTPGQALRFEHRRIVLTRNAVSNLTTLPEGQAKEIRYPVHEARSGRRG